MAVSLILFLLLMSYQALLKSPLHAWRLQSHLFQQQQQAYQQAQHDTADLNTLQVELRSYHQPKRLTAVELARLASQCNCQMQQATNDKQVFLGRFPDLLHLLDALPLTSGSQIIINSQGIDSQFLELIITRQES